mgnify:CR=1 FL=1
MQLAPLAPLPPLAVRALRRAGFPVRAWNRSPAKAAGLAAEGAQIMDSARAAATDADILICMLSDGPTCTEVLFGDNGAAWALRPGALVIVMSSIPVDVATDHARRCAERGLGYLDAPVSGGERGAREGNLAIMGRGPDR